MLYGLINHSIGPRAGDARGTPRFLPAPRTLLLATIKRFRAADGIECRFLDSFHRQGFMVSTSPEVGRRTRLPSSSPRRDVVVLVTGE